MFWKKKNKLPVTQEDKNWVDENIDWLETQLSKKHFLEIKTITPTKDFFDENFNNSEEDAREILKKVMSLMQICDLEFELIFFSDNVVLMDDGNILTTLSDEKGGWDSASGAIEINEKGFKIYIEKEQLKDPISLIATISHELAHEILLGENRIDENDEFLTDLTAITYGFGIFLGNSKFSFSQFSTNGGYGWQSSSQGYLPEQIIAYTMAKLSFLRKEDITYSRFLNKTMKKYFDQSYLWLIENNKNSSKID